MSGWPMEWKWAVAWRLGELSQQPTWPQLMHIRRCTHRSPIRRQSSQPGLLGRTSATSSRCVQFSLMAMLGIADGGPGGSAPVPAQSASVEHLGGYLGRNDLD